ncbi:FAD-binding domain-containing protein [Venturia nashicola]|uniref:FAD-binding domain-containing protein n=1 Tax=Venturia nashicola TaxID=86259 RepID=A0A4Z1PWT8_9PEZI|nr:FAD-binding domain-containing protein [Venturia nashicola]TLD39423.1 FAD-binding domain-containing protein [Venturia nashicola]
MLPSLSQSLSIFLAAAQTGLAVPSAATQTACTEIKSTLLGKLFVKGDAVYTKENKDWWNAGIADMAPACIAMPSTAQDVARIVTILNNHADVPFAIKSGGHSPNRGHSSVKEGVLIALRNIKGVELDKEKSVAYVKPGGHWKDVIKPLDDLGYTVVSGRLGVVGIGGFLAQGGLSFLSAQHGMAADNIQEYEIVFSNGTIGTIKQSERPELVRAMRGGGDQFGIITRYTLQAYPIGKAWGGVRIFTGNRDQFYDALHDFIGNNHKDPKAAVIFTVSGGLASTGSSTGASSSSLFGSLGGLLGTPGSGVFSTLTGSGPKPVVALHSAGSSIMSAMGNILKSGQTGMAASRALEYSPRSRQYAIENAAEIQAASGNSSSIFMVMLNYNGPTPPKGAFGKFENLKATIDFTKTQPYSSIVSMSDKAFDYLAMHTSFRSISLPYQPNNPAYYAEIEDIWNKVSQSYIKRAKGTVTATIAYQPFPRTVGQASEKRGGNAMGLSANDKDRFILEVAGIYNKSDDDDLVQAMGKEFTDALAKKLNTQIQSKALDDLETYNPLFMNDAGPDQDVMATYKDAVEHMKLQMSVDPKGLWAKRAGGFKYSHSHPTTSSAE